MDSYVAAPRGYEALADVLSDAIDQAANGKGAERHSTGEPFDEQPMLSISHMVGPGFCTGQVMKKCQEATMFFNSGEHGRGEAELLGAINYIAGAVIWSRINRVKAS